MNVITIELCAEDRARLDKIIEKLGGLRQPDCSACVKGVASYMDKAAAVMDARPVAPAPAPAPVPEAVPVNEPAKPTVTLEQIQKKATQIAAGDAGKKAAIRALVSKYAARVTDIPQAAWTEVWVALCELESGA